MREASAPIPVDPAAVLRRVFWRLIPFLFALYVFAYLDRVNLSYAALSIRRELGFSDTVYGAGAGLFFLSPGEDRAGPFLVFVVGRTLGVAGFVFEYPELGAALADLV